MINIKKKIKKTTTEEASTARRVTVHMCHAVWDEIIHILTILSCSNKTSTKTVESSIPEKLPESESKKYVIPVNFCLTWLL